MPTTLQLKGFQSFISIKMQPIRYYKMGNCVYCHFVSICKRIFFACTCVQFRSCMLKIYFLIAYDAFISINPCDGNSCDPNTHQIMFKVNNYTHTTLFASACHFNGTIFFNFQLHQFELLLSSSYLAHKMECYCNRFILLFDFVICSTFIKYACASVAHLLANLLKAIKVAEKHMSP